MTRRYRDIGRELSVFGFDDAAGESERLELEVEVVRIFVIPMQ